MIYLFILKSLKVISVVTILAGAGGWIWLQDIRLTNANVKYELLIEKINSAEALHQQEIIIRNNANKRSKRSADEKLTNSLRDYAIAIKQLRKQSDSNRPAGTSGITVIADRINLSKGKNSKFRNGNRENFKRLQKETEANFERLQKEARTAADRCALVSLKLQSACAWAE